MGWRTRTGPAEGPPGTDHAAANATRVAERPDGTTIDHFHFEQEMDGEKIVEERFVVQLPNGEIAVAQPKSGEIPDELRPNGGSN